MADYQLPSSFSGGMQGGIQSLQGGNVPQAVASPVVQPVGVKQTSLPAPKPKPKPVDPNKTAEVFKKKFIEKHGDGVAEDGRKYSEIPANEIVAKVIRKYGDGVTTDGTPYRDYLPRPASPDDSLEYRLKQIESLSTAPKSEFSTNGTIRGQTEKEKQFTTEVMDRKNENELVKTIKAPYRGLESVGQNLAFGTAGLAADVVDTFGGDELAGKIRNATEAKQFTTGLMNENKGLIGGIQEGSPSSIIQTLASGAGYLATGARIPLYLTALAQGGNLSLEGEQQGQGNFGDKVIAYSTGGISAAIDRMSGQKVIGGLERAGIKKETATTFVQRMNNYMKTLKPSDFEAGTEVIQQKIENIGRELMGVQADEGIKQYFEAGLLGKALGKIGDKGFSESEVTTLPPALPKVPRAVNKNLDVIQTIKTGLGGNKVLKQAKGRGFDPELDIATYEDLKPTITNDGKVNTDVAQENIQNFIEPYQEKLDQAIEQEGAIVPSDTFRQKVLQEMEGEKGNIVDYKKWIKLANDAIDTAVENFGDEQGNIPLASVNAIKKKLQMASNYLNPDDTAYKAIARGAKQIVEDFTKSADVKALNNDLARWYTTREYLQILGSGTKTVKGGRLGKYAARLSGIIIGSHLGPIAGMIGGEVAAKLQSEMMKGALKNTNTGMPEIESFNNIKLPSRQTSEDTKASKTMLPPPAQVSEGTRKKEVVLPKKESSGEKVTPIIPKSQPKAKLRTNEDALKKPETKLPKTPQDGKTVEGKINLDDYYKADEKFMDGEGSKLPPKRAKTIQQESADGTVREVKVGDTIKLYARGTEGGMKKGEVIDIEVYNWDDFVIKIKDADGKIYKTEPHLLANIDEITPAKPKPSLPLSQKSEVNLASEAKKYKSEPVYHGTNVEFSKFDPKKINTVEGSGDFIGEGFYFTNDKSKASKYAKQAVEKKGGKEVVKEVRLDMKNPLVINTKKDIEKLNDIFGGEDARIELLLENPKAVKKKLQELGYDGLIDNLYGQRAVFDESQIIYNVIYSDPITPKK